MNIFYVDREIERILTEVDEETGELPESAFEELERLQIARETVIEDSGCEWLNLTAEARAIREEEIALADRRRALERRADRIKRYLEYATDGEPFSSARVAMRWRRGATVKLDTERFWASNPAPELLRIRDPEPALDAIKTALKAGAEIPGAELVETKTMSIK